MDSTTPAAPRNGVPEHGREATALRDAIRARALALGFAACGFTGAEDLDCGVLLSDWLAAQRHGLMDYLERDPQRRLSPRATLASAASVITVAWKYPGAAVAPDPDWRARLTGRVAAYALGPDYHVHLAEKLELLAAFVRECGSRATEVQVDGGPLVERHLARRAGLGWYGHNTMLLHPRHGSTSLLGCLLTDLPLPVDEPVVADHCGSCRACLPACPTGALDHGPTIDARLCISYLTIELRGPIPRELRARIGNWVFGCDACQDVCPWNHASGLAHALLRPSLPGLLAMDEDEFRQTYAGTALVRPKRRGLARNAAVALGNSANAAALEPLARALAEHDEALVRAHAAWALGELAGARAELSLLRAEAVDPVAPVRRAAGAALRRARRPNVN
ncbi:MAG: tRNA epoxyqueuosine(34) reductase QueG [Deltaproteobacteria bacterium]|nr:tRNA epoxyqueuosine(34) reductase QueG [Deltaproteobacteria bacterium]